MKYVVLWTCRVAKTAFLNELKRFLQISRKRSVARKFWGEKSPPHPLVSKLAKYWEKKISHISETMYSRPTLTLTVIPALGLAKTPSKPNQSPNPNAAHPNLVS